MGLRFSFSISGFLLLLTAGNSKADEFLAGADFSHLAYFEERGAVYRDNGQPRDALEMLEKRGLNCVRLRLFTSSAEQAQSDPYNSINNLDYTLPLANRAKNAGLRVLLDFHYSDSWADPGKQNKPLAWEDLTFGELVQRMYEYNFDTIAAFRDAGVMPEYVQVGNEIIGGLLWPDGRVGGNYDTLEQWSQLADLLQAAMSGIMDAAGDQPPKIIIHIDRGGDWGGTEWFFDNLRQQRVSFDIIGESYYPWWHGNLEALRETLNNAAVRYEKPVIIAETAFPWSDPFNEDPIVGIMPGEQGQIDFLIELAKIVNTLPDGLGAGIFWWGSEYVHLPDSGLGGFDRRSFFDFEGNILPVADAFGQLTLPVELKATLDEGNATLRWPLSGAGMSLETTSDLMSPATWLPVADPIQGAAEGFTTTLPNVGESTRFFRLRSE